MNALKGLREKINESLTSVLPITAIVLVLSISVAPLTPGALILFLFGAVTMAAEWKRIAGPVHKKILYTFTFPLFMLTYVPISVAALVGKVEWRPIRYGIASSNSSIES